MYLGKGWPLDKTLLGNEETAQKLGEKSTSDEKWEFIRSCEESKVDWEHQFKVKFQQQIDKKVGKVEKNFDRFFETDIKKLKKDMKRYLKKFKFNLKILYNDAKGNWIIPASKVAYFEHALWATYYPKKLMEISKMKNMEIQAVSKEHELLRTVTKKFTLTSDWVKTTWVPAAPEIMIGSYDESQISFITISYSYIDFFQKLLEKPKLYERKFDDIDPEYGLHDYSVKIEIRNNKEPFWYELFPGLFTRKKDLKKGYAVFKLIDSADNHKHFNFNGRIEYPCESMVASDEFKNLCFVDILMLDEFNDPFISTSRACRLISVRHNIFYIFD